jgi:hypothetical protein
VTFKGNLVFIVFSVGVKMSIEQKIEFIIAVRNYACEKRQKWAEGIDFTASDNISEEKILLRSIEPQGGTGFVSVDDVRKMLKVMKNKDCSKGFLVAKRFTDAATQEMTQGNIQPVSDEYMPPCEPKTVYTAINDCTTNLCKNKCGEISLKKSKCQDNQKGKLCRVKSINDDALFHFERGWQSLLRNDLIQLLSEQKTMLAKTPTKATLVSYA